MKSSPRGRSGVSTGTPIAVATSFTGEGLRWRPRPAGRSGCVTTPTTSWPSSSRARNEDTAKSGVPQKRILTSVGALLPPRPGASSTSSARACASADSRGRGRGCRAGGRSRAAAPARRARPPRRRSPSPPGSRASMRTAHGRSTTSSNPGMLRHPSGCLSVCSLAQTTFGLTRATRFSGSSSRRRSTTSTRLETPTCGAARPIPSARYIVSNMSRTSPRSSSSKTSTGSASVRSTGSPINTTSRTDIELTPWRPSATVPAPRGRGRP